MEARVTGGCQCGAVRYAIRAPFGRPSICHCRMCQKAFGSYFAPFVSVPLGNFETTRGELAIFKSSDLVERGFCRNCGTPLSIRDIDREEIEISLGSLDNPAALKPLAQVGIESRMPWFAELAALPGSTTGDYTESTRLGSIASTNRQHPDHDTAEWPQNAP